MILPPRAREIRGNRRKGKGGVRGSPFGGPTRGGVMVDGAGNFFVSTKANHGVVKFSGGRFRESPSFVKMLVGLFLPPNDAGLVFGGEAAVLEPLGRFFAIFPHVDSAGVNEGIIAILGVADGGSPFYSHCRVVMDDSGGIAVAGRVALVGRDAGDGLGSLLGTTSGPSVEAGADGVIFAVAIGELTCPLNRFGRVFFGKVTSESLVGLVLQCSFGDVLGPGRGLFRIAGPKDGICSNMNHFTRLLVAARKSLDGEFRGKIGIGIGESENGSPFHVVATVFGIFRK